MSLVGATATAVQPSSNRTAPLDNYAVSAAYSFSGTGLDKQNPWVVPVADINEIGSNMCNIAYLDNRKWSGTGLPPIQNKEKSEGVPEDDHLQSAYLIPIPDAVTGPRLRQQPKPS